MKQFLTPEPKQTYTIAKEFTFLLYPFNLTWSYDNKITHPFKGIYHESLDGKIDKSGKFKFTMNLVHGPSVETHGYSGGWNTNKERMALRECFVVVDSDDEKKSKLVISYDDKESEWILGNVPKEITYCIFTDFVNNSKNDHFSIPYPEPRDYSVRYEKKEFPNIITKDELVEPIKYYQDICDNAINVENEKFNKMISAYKVRLDKKIEGNIPIEYTLSIGTKFKFIKFEPRFMRGSHKKYKHFVEIEIDGHTTYLTQEDFSGMWVE